MSVFQNISNAEVYLPNTSGIAKCVKKDEIFTANNFFKCYCTGDNAFERAILKLISDDGLPYPPPTTNIKTMKITQETIDVDGDETPIQIYGSGGIFKNPPYHFQISNFGTVNVIIKINDDDTGFQLNESMVQVFEKNDIEIANISIILANGENAGDGENPINIELLMTGGELI